MSSAWTNQIKGTCSQGTRSVVERLEDREALVHAIETEIGIPGEVTREAIAGLGKLGSFYG